MTESKFEAIAAFPNTVLSNTDTGLPNTVVPLDDESRGAMRTEFANIDFHRSEVMLLSSQFMMHIIHYGEPDDLFYYVWREPAGIFGASVWGSALVPERIEEMRVEPREVVEHRYFRPEKNAPVGTRVVGLAEKRAEQLVRKDNAGTK